jgi:hypothetical protein
MPANDRSENRISAVLELQMYDDGVYQDLGGALANALVTSKGQSPY